MFRQILLTDKDWMNRCREEGTNDMTVLSFPAVYMWQSIFGLTISGDERFYVVKSVADEGYYYPVGQQEACREWVLSVLQGQDAFVSGDMPAHQALSVLQGQDAPAGCGRSFKLVYVPEGELEWLESLGFEISCDPSTSEYVYSSRSMALLDNGAGKNYRSKIHGFSREYRWTVSPFRFPADEDLLRKKIDAWLKDPISRDVPDRAAVAACAENPAMVGLSGVHIEADTGEWAFLLGYPSTPEIYDMAIVKYCSGFSRNVVPVCLCELSKLVCDTFSYINLEDDMGVPGLRTSKKLYHPVFLLDSYTARI